MGFSYAGYLLKGGILSRFIDDGDSMRLESIFSALFALRKRDLEKWFPGAWLSSINLLKIPPFNK